MQEEMEVRLLIFEFLNLLCLNIHHKNLQFFNSYIIICLSSSLDKQINQQYLICNFFFSIPWIQPYDGMPPRLQENQCYILSRYDSVHNWSCLLWIPVLCDWFCDIYDLAEWIWSTYQGKNVEAINIYMYVLFNSFKILATLQGVFLFWSKKTFRTSMRILITFDGQRWLHTDFLALFFSRNALFCQFSC